MAYSLEMEWWNNMNDVNIRQLYDDLAYFYPITCVDAVVGGSVSAGVAPKEIDLGSYISGNFSGIFKLYIYDDTLYFFDLKATVNEGFNVTPSSNNLIAHGIPVAYYPLEPLVFKTVTDDSTCKANVLLDTNGELSLQIISRADISTNESDGSTVINKMVNITTIEASAVAIIV